MGFLSSVTGFLGKVASGIGHVIAPGADFTPSGLLKEAGKLLPSLTEGIPGVGPLISKGISAVESVFGGSERSDPTEDTSPVTLPGLDEVKGMVASSQKAILDTREALNSKLTTIAKDLHGDLSKFKDDELTALHKIDVGIREKLDKEDFTLEKIYTDLHNTDEHLATVDEHVLEILKEARQSQSAILKKFEALNDLTAAEEDRHERERTHDRLRKKYEESQKPMTDAITWLTDHLSKFHSYISYENNDEIGDYLEVSGVHHTAFSGAHLDLRKAVEGLSLSLQKDFPPTQELLDLYAFGVHWLLIFDKLVLTLRYFHAHAVFNGEGAQKTEYTEVQRHWNEDLGNMIADAKKAAQFILGRPANGRQGEQTGFVEKLWQFRLNQIWKPQYYLEDKTLRNVWCFIDHYALHGVGAAKFSLARWRISRRCLFVVRCGRWHDADTNSTAREEENRDLKDEMDALYAGYVGLQTSYYQASTRPVLEMAHAWRASADHWKSIAPPHVPHASKNPPLAFQFTIPKHVEKAVNKARGKGLRDEDLDKGKGYPAGSNVEYAVSYVTAHGEGKMSSWEKANKGDPLSANWPSTLMMLELGPIRFQTPSHDDLVEKQDARDSDKRVTAPVVRRVYARHQGVIRHLIDVSAPIQKPVLVCDLGPSSKPEAVVVEQAPVRNNDEWYDDDEVASPHPYTTIAAAHLAGQPVGHLDLPTGPASVGGA